MVKGLRVDVASGCSHLPLKQIKGRAGALTSQARTSVGHRGDQQDENRCCFFLSMLKGTIHQRDKCLFSVLWPEVRQRAPAFICIGDANGNLLLEK